MSDTEYTLVYTPTGGRSHLMTVTSSGIRNGQALCKFVSWNYHWLGTGSQEEFEEARRRDICKNCLKYADMRMLPWQDVILQDHGWLRRVKVGLDKEIVFYRDKVCFYHKCRKIETGRFQIWSSPALDPRHQMISRNPVTISPSIHCPDCDTHGFVANSKWRDA